MAFDASRLYSQLLNTGLQGKDNPLYQVIYQLIRAVGQATPTTSGFSGGGSSSIVNVFQAIQQLELGDGGDSSSEGFTIPGPRGIDGIIGRDGLGAPGLDGNDGEDGFPGPPGPAGATTGGTGTMVPYFNPLGTEFIVPLYSQALFGMNIDNEGIITVDGFLIETDTQYSPNMAEFISSINQTPASTAEVQVQFDVPATYNNGITLVSNSILIPEPGIYEFIFTGQIGETSNGKVQVTVWYKLNGVDVAYSGNQQFVDLAINTGVLTADELFRCVAGDRVSVYFAVDNATRGAGLISITPAVGAVCPSAMINVKKVGA